MRYVTNRQFTFRTYTYAYAAIPMRGFLQYVQPNSLRFQALVHFLLLVSTFGLYTIETFLFLLSELMSGTSLDRTHNNNRHHTVQFSTLMKCHSPSSTFEGLHIEHMSLIP